MHRLTQQFRFEAAHTLHRAVGDIDGSRRIHGHSYRAEVTIAGVPDPETGMVMDCDTFSAHLEGVRSALDHRFLDEVALLGPATLENLCVWIWGSLKLHLTGLHKVTVIRDSCGDRCSYKGKGTTS